MLQLNLTLEDVKIARTSGGPDETGRERGKMPPRFSSDLDFIEQDVRLCHRRAADLTEEDRWIQPSELQWLERKLKAILECFDGQE